jgi:hypothetical protein
MRLAIKICLKNLVNYFILTVKNYVRHCSVKFPQLTPLPAGHASRDTEESDVPILRECLFLIRRHRLCRMSNIPRIKFLTFPVCTHVRKNPSGEIIAANRSIFKRKITTSDCCVILVGNMCRWLRQKEYFDFWQNAKLLQHWINSNSPRFVHFGWQDETNRIEIKCQNWETSNLTLALV